MFVCVCDDRTSLPRQLILRAGPIRHSRAFAQTHLLTSTQWTCDDILTSGTQCTVTCKRFFTRVSMLSPLSRSLLT